MGPRSSSKRPRRIFVRHCISTSLSSISLHNTLICTSEPAGLPHPLLIFLSIPAVRLYSRAVYFHVRPISAIYVTKAVPRFRSANGHNMREITLDFISKQDQIDKSTLGRSRLQLALVDTFKPQFRSAHFMNHVRSRKAGPQASIRIWGRRTEYKTGS